jgi:hypothetical protein
MRLGASLGLHFHPRKRPLDKVWDDEFIELGLWGNVVLAVVQFGFAAIHMAAWNFHFPTGTEAFLWHLSCLYILGSMAAT